MNLTDFAHEYQIAGFNPVPLKMDKSPALPAGERYLEEFVSSKWIDTHFKNAQKIGVAGGKVSENLVCIDFDMHNEGEDVSLIFDEFIKTELVSYLIKIKVVALYSTPSGGKHIIFRTPETERSQKLAYYKTGKVMIETKAEGGYIACYPSEGYVHIGGCELINVNEIDDEAYIEMMEMARSFSEFIPEESIERKNASGDTIKWGESWKPTTPDGFYNLNEGDAALKLLLDNGWQENTIRQSRNGITFLTRPGKKQEDGISATWGYRKNMFYVFTSSDDHFKLPPEERGRAFTPFEILVTLEYNGDWRKAKDDLRELYGMQKKVKVKAPILSPEQEKQFKTEPFPIEVFPEDIQNFIKQMKLTLNYSPDIAACAIISAVSSLVGNTVKVKVKNGWETPMIFWFIVRGRAGSVKSHPVDTVISPLNKINKTAYDFYQEQLKEWNALDDQEKNKTPKPQFKQVLVDDATVESFRKILSYNPRGVLLHNDEIKQFIKGMNKYKSGDTGEEAFWLKSFNNASFTVNRVKDDPVVIDNTFINIIGTIQNDVLDDILSKSQESGFIDRFLFSRPEEKAHKLSKTEMDRNILHWWYDYCVTLHTTFKFDDQVPYVVEFSESAFELLQKNDAKFVDISNDEESSEKMRSYISKIRTYIPRFALFFCIIDHFDPIVEQEHLRIEYTHVNRANKIAQYFYNTGMSIFEENQITQELKNIDKQHGMSSQERIEVLYKKGISQKDISAHIKKSRQYVSKVIKKLKQEGDME